jgi:hypothetical protein
MNCRQHLFIKVMERIMTAVVAARQTLDMKFEVAVIPVSDIDRSKRFYEDLGWRLDADFVRSDGLAPYSSRLRARQARFSSVRDLRHASTSQ